MSQTSTSLSSSVRRASDSPGPRAGSGKRPHVYELDPLRACTALSVIAVHVLAATAFLNGNGPGYAIQNAFLVAFHFTREIFMFVTAFALVYVYNGRRFPLGQFWRKRSLGVIFPYVFWSLVYVVVNTHPSSWSTFFKTALFDVATGNASYQLYYILLTIQFYLIFPLFMGLLKRWQRHPWLLLFGSFALQVLLFYVDYHTVQRSSDPFWHTVAVYQDRFVLMYQFYFVLGGLAALYFERVRAFVLRHARLIIILFVLTLLALWVHFAEQISVYREPMGYATSVLQPSMVFYSVAVIGLALWLCSRWAIGFADLPGREVSKRLSVRFWALCSDASFGVYLIHVLILNQLRGSLLSLLPGSWPVALRVVLLWSAVAILSLAISSALMYTPWLSRLVGRAGPRPRSTGSHQSQRQGGQAEALPDAGRRQPAPTPTPTAATIALVPAVSQTGPADAAGASAPQDLRSGALARYEQQAQHKNHCPDSAGPGLSDGRHAL
ncbi:acyltransferase [Thermogemmatispora onikobensis]|uniref:acyltransferase n=1 Tax=Thermogemmatispora onikobensis TaxID=732234 RepID=UPI00085364DB|nr:acyltransferase [Thermogemmatispora onikobensis]